MAVRGDGLRLKELPMCHHARRSLARALAELNRKADLIMSQLDDINIALAQEQADTAALVGTVDQLVSAVGVLVAGQGAIPADVQAVLDSVASTLAGTHTDTSGVEGKLSDLLASVGPPAPPV
jgi:ABC-type transporter Mla subunit MlaD